ncbi:hypothetical protein [Alkalihalobacillus pseudalcaliphilus]|uniref:hypothetical protein n=1 Tax=Alkalihalobacillus pseudalcaliphilus TaxID=79884 RepID=UPI00064D82AE|nr:hypothetical protein [Alkalihalobacillus pseudalcaliphilus]KMK75326.1 hypothetical protein AB990_18105 [Alkalihalobacillus pseudalcaliphilus]
MFRTLYYFIPLSLLILIGCSNEQNQVLKLAEKYQMNVEFLDDWQEEKSRIYSLDELEIILAQVSESIYSVQSNFADISAVLNDEQQINATLHSYIQGTPSIERNVTLSYENEEMNQVESYSIGGGELVWVQTSYHQRPNYVIIAGYWVGNFQTDKGMVAFRENDTWFIEKPQTMMSMND